MRNGIGGIDHVVIGVRDLERAQMAWTRLGFALSPRGRHLGQGTGNYCVMFPDAYLELLGIVERDASVEGLAAFLARREGPRSIAFAPDGDIDALRQALVERGFHPGEARTLGRQLELAEGTVVPRFRLVGLPAAETPGLDCFVCGHLTPELLRRPAWLAHPNGAVSLKTVHVLVEDTVSLLHAYDRLFGLQEVTTTDAVASIRVGGGHRILFSTMDDFLTMHPGIDLDPDMPLPGIVALEIGVADRGRAADHLAQWQVPFAEMPDGNIVVPAAAADGAVIFFTRP